MVRHSRAEALRELRVPVGSTSPSSSKGSAMGASSSTSAISSESSGTFSAVGEALARGSGAAEISLSISKSHLKNLFLARSARSFSRRRAPASSVRAPGRSPVLILRPVRPVMVLVVCMNRAIQSLVHLPACAPVRPAKAPERSRRNGARSAVDMGSRESRKK